MGRDGRSRNKQNSRRRRNRKFDGAEESSSSTDNEIQGDAPGESASGTKTTEHGKLKGDAHGESSSSSRTTGHGKIKGELQDLPVVKASLEQRISEWKLLQAEKAAQALEKRIRERPLGDDFYSALKQSRKNVINLRQESYEDIPVFPYAYADKKKSPIDNKRAPPLWVTEIYDDQYIVENFSVDWLPSSPTVEQLDNLYGQLNQYAFDVCFHIMESSRVVKLAHKVVEVKLAHKVVEKCLEEILLKGTPVTSACDELSKELYHIIRIKDTREEIGGFLDFLRANSNGYVGAWRWLKDLTQAKTAVWCYFWDEPAIVDILKFLKFVPTRYGSAYTFVEDVKIGFGTLEFGIDTLKHVYFKPDGPKSKGAELFVQFFFVLLGEGPRSDILKRIIKSNICSESHERSPRLGVMIQGVITNWGFLSRTAFFLRLMMLELALGKNLIKEKPDPNDPLKPHPSLQKLFLQFAHNYRVAQCMCDRVVGNVKRIDQEYDLIKQEVDGKLIYGSVSYGKIVDNCLSLLLHDEKLVCAIIMRDKGSDETVGLEGEVSVEEDEFWVDFDKVKMAYKKEPKTCILMRFLPYCVPVLQRWKYASIVDDSLGIEEINSWCVRYNDYKLRMPEADAGELIVNEWKLECKQILKKLRDIVRFIEMNRLKSSLV